MTNDYLGAYKGSMAIMVYRRALELIFCLGLFCLSTGLILFSSPQLSFAQLSSSPETPPSQEEVQGANELEEFEAAREQYLLAWNNTGFTSRFDVFIAEGTDGLYGVYREHVPANVFRPGETMVLYVEPVGFGQQAITDTSTEDGSNSNASVSRPLYLLNMTADIMGTDASGAQIFAIEDLPVAVNLISHRQVTEIPMMMTLTQEEPFPVGDYIITYVVHDHITGQSFQLDRQITIDDDAITGALPLPDFRSDNSIQPPVPEQQPEEPSQAIGP